MQKITIAFDVDGTLRCNCTETCEDPNADVVLLFRMLAKMKNTEMYVWSGGGADYARGFARLYGLPVKEDHCISKNLIGRDPWRFDPPIAPDIAVDDIQDFNLGKLNLIVREK